MAVVIIGCVVTKKSRAALANLASLAVVMMNYAKKFRAVAAFAHFYVHLFNRYRQTEKCERHAHAVADEGVDLDVVR